MTTITTPAVRSEERRVRIPLDDATAGQLTFTGAAPVVVISADSRPDRLAEAEFAGNLPHISTATGEVRLAYRASRNPATWIGSVVQPAMAAIRLARGLPWDLRFDGSVHRLDADLRDLDGQIGVRIRGSVTTGELRLPRPRGTVRVAIGGSVSHLVLVRPAGVPVRITVRGAIASFLVDGARLGARARGFRGDTHGWTTATDRIEVSINGAATQLELRSSGGPNRPSQGVPDIDIPTPANSASDDGRSTPMGAPANGALPTPKETNMTQAETGVIASKDGTTIGFIKLGQGPALVIYHGAFVSARSFSQLAERLAEAHTVYVPDRRGRGSSGPFPAEYCMQTEIDDLEAVLAVSGAHDVFAISAGALVSLRAALTNPTIRRLALYEPALSVDGSFRPTSKRLDEEIARGRVAAALVTGMLETRIAPPALSAMPRRMVEAMTNLSLKSEDKKAAAGDITMRALAPTLHYDIELIREAADTQGDYRSLGAKVLLLGGSKGPGWAKTALDTLEQVLPDVARVELAGLDHGGATNPGNTSRNSDPGLVATELLRFFA